MTKTQRIGFVLVLLAALGLATGTGPHWVTQSAMLAFGYALFVFDDFSRFLVVTLLRAVWWGGWLYRRARGLPEPRKQTA